MSNGIHDQLVEKTKKYNKKIESFNELKQYFLKGLV